MSKTKIFSYVTLVVALILGYYLYHSISSKIEEDNRIKTVEANVIDKLKMIREAQLAYKSVNGQFTSDWNKLVNFVKDGKIYLVEKKEIIIPRQYGGDSIYVQVDTLGFVPVRDSLFNETIYPNFVADNLPIIPGSGGKKFEMFADKIEKGGNMVDVVEVKDIAPVNPKRKETNEILILKPLRFGSRTEITTSGNWE
ncbi:hypothetical protein QWY31_07325 [Cytophagales bacterium LB-30]|uniref:Uncharacterized protein n=1 Tax=Shiella aurantiaca TaxID=3058365 RepID=A0ABT8F5R7_9BACT|nr:hypothetical protein [Shiella aurantiaca]MDN4165306.1 hypothetical protein [Shiella aurantiaca]